MEYLSWLFFCLSPFVLFCSEDGNGLILCPVFIILGLVFKCIGSSVDSAGTVKVEPQKFWEWHYKHRMNSMYVKKDAGDEGKMAIHDREARDWATTICGYHNAWVPPDDIQEQIARENGVITEKMLKANKIKKDRIQIGKYFLMCKLKLKYDEVKTWHVSRQIERDMGKIKMSHHRSADDWYVKQEYGKTVSEIWKTLSLDEKQQVEKWVKEYEEKLLWAVKDCGDKGLYVIRPINMDF